ncbi:MAG: ribonuclease Z [Cyanothece sp. SIO1E1]|nr:ribonuclease Z [Cyanothece sp. SIO1E1]
MMQLIFLGSGSAFTIGDDNFQCNLLLISPQGRSLLIDCGSDLRFSLRAAGFTPSDITDVYISHLHSDHVGGLEYLGFSTLFNANCPRPHLFLSQDLVNDLWERTLCGGMGAIEGQQTQLDIFFQVCPIALNDAFHWQDISFQLVKVPHVHNGQSWIPSYGLFFEIAGTRIFFTTDTQFSPQILTPYYEQADLILHDCETSAWPTPVHAGYQQLKQLPLATRQKMWLHGYQPGPKPNAQLDGFQGFIQRGQAFEFGHSNNS